MTLEQLAAELMALRERVAVLESRQQPTPAQRYQPYQHPPYTPPTYEITC